VSANKLKLMVN